ncbi:hypothetical protein ES319_A10G189500v1 [Gossypium barbadense]|uniref:Protein kinase domain-containing protein n=2 Tax=Gossypium TaxID=3633 RepID=A0A5J5U5P7_GOSBA|nr:hypothetical protein ES319_A10G189500v1 [Gossypium barbadense]TYG99642.1 hypothetical protein ES288_A10G211400v1 [Gossypium darwinii]
MSGMPTRFSYEELKNVTKNFSNKLGEGGFGFVFHGALSSGSEVAVKHLFGIGPVNKSFIAEVQTIGSIHHFNLDERHLLELLRRKQEEGQLLDLVDKCNDDMQSNVAEVVEMIKVAAWCLQTEYANRPSMSTLVKHFEGSVDAVINVNEDFQNELTSQAPVESFASSITPSVLSGPR